ncbi:DUF3108 domain-containing protein [Acetobacteraceae bacterium H6797]|nr:DUF3108 domain-containing protein [Acetobacteraceae bacterium H6797]
MKHALAPLFVCALASLPVAQAAAQPVRVQYNLTMLGGMSLGQIDATLTLDREGYRIETRTRPAGMARLFGSGEQMAEVDGRWGRSGPEPQHYISTGSWRGEAKLTELQYRNGVPVSRRIDPPVDNEREPVPPELIGGTMDALSVLAKLTRQVAETGTCDGQAAIYDGRRRADAVARTVGWQMLNGGSGTWRGRALNCSFESRLVAGFKVDEDRERAARPLAGRAWIAPAEGNRPPLPVRVEFETRWFGTVAAQLVLPPAQSASNP